MGPGTHLKKRLKRGDLGINRLDWIAKQHNIDYSRAKTLKDKYVADRKMIRAIGHLPGRKTKIRKKCSRCFKLLRGRQEREEHRCGYALCPACKEQVDIQTHRCFVQVAPPQEEDATPRPFHVFFDIESRQEDGQHISNLVVAETEVEDDPFRFQGETCLQQFTTWLDYLAEETGRPLTVLAHNFQGYDSYPLVEE